MSIKIVDLRSNDEPIIEQAAILLLEGFAEHHAGAWPDLESALEEVRGSVGEERISRVALDERGMVVGWIVGVSLYDGRVWELHPLVVGVLYQGQGIGRALITDFEHLVRARGGLTITLGTDDEDYQTTLAGKNLLPNVFEHVASIRNLSIIPTNFTRSWAMRLLELYRTPMAWESQIF